MREPDGFRDFVVARSPALVRSAWLLTGNEATAQDLVQVALSEVWRRWGSIQRQDAPEIYVRRVMMTTFLTWSRRRWHKETPAAVLPDLPGLVDPFQEADLRHVLTAALATLPRRQRGVLVLRFFEDMTEAQVADVMGCSIGTVKSQAFKALARLRADVRLKSVLFEEEFR